MENLIFIDNQKEEISKWVDSSIPHFIVYFKRGVKYKGEYGFGWYERGDYLFNYFTRSGNTSSRSESGKNDFSTAHSDKACHSLMPKLKNEYNNRKDITNDNEYRIPIITFYPEINSLSLDVLLNFSTLPDGASNKEKKVYWEAFRRTKLFFKSSDKNVSFEKSELLLDEYSLRDSCFETFLINNEICARNLNEKESSLYIPDIKINISGAINSDAKIWVEDADGKIIGLAEIKANGKILELPIQFVIPYRKDKKKIEVESVLSKLGDIDSLLDKMNNFIFCQSLVRFKYENASEKLLYLELRPSTDYVTNDNSRQFSAEEQQEYNEKLLFSQAITSELECFLDHTNSYLKSEAEKLNIKNNVFIVFLSPFRYYKDNINAAGSSPVYDRSGVLILKNSLSEVRIIAHELGHAMGLLHCDIGNGYNYFINKAEEALKENRKEIAPLDEPVNHPTAHPNETEIAFERRYYTELSQKNTLTAEEIKIKSSIETNIACYDKIVTYISYYENKIALLKIAAGIDNYAIEDTENLMYHSNEGRSSHVTLYPWQAKVIKELNN